MSKNNNFIEKEIDNYEGPFINMYLKGFTPGHSKKKYKTLEEALENADRNKYCSGITLSRQGYFTLRLGKDLKISDKNNKFKNKEISWKKIENKREFNFVEGRGKKEEQYEIIKYGNEKYYYNQYTKKGININSNKEYIMRRGKFYLID